jgi:hypothetical protein
LKAELTSNIRRIIIGAIIRDILDTIRSWVIQHRGKKRKGIEDHGFGAGMSSGKIGGCGVDDAVVCGKHGGVGERTG